MAKGTKTGGGSRKGKPNKATKAREEAIAASGVTPLEFMLDIMRGKCPEGSEPAEQIAFAAMRLDAAKAAAPYVHPRLANIEHSGPNKGPIVVAAQPTDERL